MKRTPGLSLVFLGASLAGLLALQVSWLWKAASLREALFVEKARRVLQETAAEVGPLVKWKDKNLSMGSGAVEKVDRLFRQNLNRYGLDLPYTFKVNQLQAPNLSLELSQQKEDGTFATCLPGPEEGTGVLLELQFPEKSRFVFEEMGFQFALSLGLISVLLGVSWQAIRRFRREQEILEQSTLFLNNMTHEWKTPISTIRLAIRRLLDAETKGQAERVRRYARVVAEENDRLSNQVEWVLDRRRLRNIAWKPVNESVDVHLVLNQVSSDFRLQAEEKQIHISLDFCSEGLILETDPWALASLLRNLLDNAIRYSPNESQVSLKTNISTGVLQIRICDEGPGIPSLYQERIFEPFFRVPQGDRYETKGFGLGLSYARTLAEKMGYRLQLDQKSVSGSVFILEIPYV